MMDVLFLFLINHPSFLISRMRGQEVQGYPLNPAPRFDSPHPMDYLAQ
jgi:hypothetical protein